jgi:hypothetical protein
VAGGGGVGGVLRRLARAPLDDMTPPTPAHTTQPA